MHIDESVLPTLAPRLGLTLRRAALVRMRSYVGNFYFYICRWHQRFDSIRLTAMNVARHLLASGCTVAEMVRVV